MKPFPRITECECGQCKMANIFADFLERGEVEYAMSRQNDLRALREHHDLTSLTDPEFMELCMRTGMMVAQRIIADNPEHAAVIAKLDADMMVAVGQKMQAENAAKMH